MEPLVQLGRKQAGGGAVDGDQDHRAILLA
jgi:hypothetical protein